jgi:hypothetical protein
MAQQMAWQRESGVWGGYGDGGVHGGVWYPAPHAYEPTDPSSYPLAAPIPSAVEDAQTPSASSTSLLRLDESRKEARPFASHDEAGAGRRRVPLRAGESRFHKYLSAASGRNPRVNHSRESDSDTSGSTDDDDGGGRKGRRFKAKRAGRSVKQRKLHKASKAGVRVSDPDESWLESVFGGVMFEIFHGDFLLHATRFGLLCAMAWSLSSIVFSLTRLVREEMPKNTNASSGPGQPP